VAGLFPDGASCGVGFGPWEDGGPKGGLSWAWPAAECGQGTYTDLERVQAGQPKKKRWAVEPSLPEEVVAARFEEIKVRDPANRFCVDCGSPDKVDWASTSFGTFLCIVCSKYHKKLLPFTRVRSCMMDPWTDQQLHIFDHGGNRRLREFFEVNKVTRDCRRRYHTRAAGWYREDWIRNVTLGCTVPDPPKGTVPPSQVRVLQPPQPWTTSGELHALQPSARVPCGSGSLEQEATFDCSWEENATPEVATEPDSALLTSMRAEREWIPTPRPRQKY